MWDKARIARIIGNAKYIGDGEYDPIIEEEQYEEAAAVKTARQRNTFEKNLEGLDLLRDLVRCAECGAPMRRRVSSKHRGPYMKTGGHPMTVRATPSALIA